MSTVVMVHGAFNELWGPHEIKARWLPALRDGLWHHGADISPDATAVAFYGDLFRRDPGADDETAFDAARDQAKTALADASGPFSLTALHLATGAAVRDRTLDMIATMATDHDLADEMVGRLEVQVSAETRVVIGHSLGSIVAYEALRRHPEWGVHTLITLGCPLGQPVVLSSVVPSAAEGGDRPWPGSVQRWVNVAAVGDLLASIWDLSPIFGSKVENLRVDNGHRAHAPEPYLNAHQTGGAVAAALAG